VASVKWNQPLGFTFCKSSVEEQNIEIGRYEGKDGARVLRPLGNTDKKGLHVIWICF
jgi:hypothetical protein